jgi:hypothetical protein
MPKINSIYLNFYTLVNIERQVKYSTDVRVEECHGFHTFIDQEVLSNEIVRVSIKFKDKEIDITNRLTKEELSLLDKIQEDELDPV